MKLRQYTDNDYESIVRWYRGRNLTCPKPASFPKVGLIVPDVAVGFLMQTDTDCAILEPFVSNPARKFETRDKALLVIMDGLVGMAQDGGYKQVFGFSNNALMVFRSQQLGFRIIEHTSVTVVKDLNK